MPSEIDFIAVHYGDGSQQHYFPEGVAPDPVPTTQQYRTLVNLNVRTEPRVGSGTLAGQLPSGVTISVTPWSAVRGDYTWRIIAEGEFSGRYVAEKNNATGTTYLRAVSGDEPAPDPDPRPVPDNAQPAPFKGRYSLQPYEGHTYLKGALGMGMNMRPLAYFPTGVMPHVNEGDALWLMRKARSWGINIIRVYFPHRDVDFGDQLELFGRVMDMASAEGLRVMAVITDSIGDSGFTIREDAEYHRQPLGHLDIEWYKGAFRTHYMPRLAKFVQTFGDRQNLLIDLINEPAIIGADLNEANYLAFRGMIHEASELVYEVGGGLVPCTVGLINTQHARVEGRGKLTHALDFYGNLPYIQVVSPHLYYKRGMTGDRFQFEDDADVDAQAAIQTGRALMIGEFGVSEALGGKRPGLLGGVVTRQIINNGASALFHWEFDPSTGFDRGYSDEYGIAAWRDSDFEGSMGELREGAVMLDNYRGALG